MMIHLLCIYDVVRPQLRNLRKATFFPKHHSDFGPKLEPTEKS